MKLLSLTAGCLLTTASFAGEPHSLDDSHHHEAHAHVHGEAALTLVLEDGELHIQLYSPAYNITGFEHEPTDEGERATVNIAAHRLRQLDTLIELPKDANCQLNSVKVNSSLLEDDHAGHNHDHDDLDKSAHHADFYVDYELSCKDTSKLNGITVKMFKQFRAVEKTKVEWVIEGKQGAAVTTPESAKVNF
ncbi:DUF2796 domain-containing protein [Porticoccaceae bacterium LTM1]|nr:DUF2796 domain-containing protein [Porticoccaceae bacterium LTM1]